MDVELNQRNRFLDPEQILAHAGIERGETVADFGCGNGFYPVAAAKIVGQTGQVYAVDVKNDSLEATQSAAKHEGCKNVVTVHHDMEQPGVPIPVNSCDAVILAGILHLAALQGNVMRETYRVLKTGGKVIVVEWKKESLPFGPNIVRRIAPREVIDLCAKSGFAYLHDMPADSFHYGLVFKK
jgi:ubiquinone/menaquinone biosynthesis C-methylase UbiE